MAKDKIAHERLRHLVDYNPETGEFTKRPQKIGWTCGRPRWRYRVVTVEGKNYLEHILAWFFMTGHWPPVGLLVDHRNGDATDNRWTNLRLATPSENQQNRARINKNNTSGLTGVYKNKKRGKPWFSVRGKKYLGQFPTKEEAHEAYRKAALEEFGKFAPDRLKKL